MTEFLKNIKSQIQNLTQNTSKVIIAVLSILSGLVIISIFLLVGQLSSGTKKSKKIKINVPETFNQTDEFYSPENDNFINDYYFSRITKDSWTKEDSDRWFTVPDNKTVDELNNKNDKLVEKILGAAP